MNELLPLLPTLITLARTGSVSQSARMLGVPRSTVSRRLARIEAVVGFKVAERSKQRFQLTEAGRRLVDGAAEALARLETVREEARAQDGELCGTFRVAVPMGAGGGFGGWFVTYLHTRYPRIQIELTVIDDRSFCLEDGFDLIVVLGAPPTSRWVRRHLGDSELLAVASPRYLQRKGTPTTVEALDHHQLLGCVRRGDAPTWPRLRGEEFPVRPCFATNDLSVLREAAVAGLGIALIPWYVIVTELATRKLVPVLPTLVGQRVSVYGLYLPERRASPLLKAVLSMIPPFAQDRAPAPPQVATN